jgi:4-amino-4-deoxy-L-arabinose transferase-like glycosyltransferase
MKYKFTGIALLIFLGAFTVRIYRLAEVPPHLSNDEISIAYDTYSVLYTGRDEHGHLLPLTFQSHDTYKAPLTAYLSAASTALFGNNETSARLPSAVLGSLTVFVFIILVYRMFRRPALALLCGLLLALAPLHIFTSHMILESNIALFFLVTGLALLFQFLENERGVTLFTALFFEALSVYGYHTEWVFTPLLLIAFWLVFYKYISIKKALAGGLLFSVLLLPLITDTFYHRGSTTRANTQNLIYEPTLQSVINNPRISLLSKTQTIANAVISNYSVYWNPGYLFAYGLDIPPQPLTTQSGLFLAIYLPFFLYGLAKSPSLSDNRKKFLWMWLLLSPLVPALTKGGANYVRALVIVPPIILVTGLGLKHISDTIKPVWIKIILIAFPSVLLFGYFCLLYFFHYPIHSGLNFEYGYRQAADYINTHTGEYSRIVVDPRFGPNHEYVGVPHLYLAYFTRYNPFLFLQNRRDLPSGLYFSPYEIREINWQAEKTTPKTLYITPASNPPPSVRNDLKEVLKIDNPDETPALGLFTGAI